MPDTVFKQSFLLWSNLSSGYALCSYHGDDRLMINCFCTVLYALRSLSQAVCSAYILTKISQVKQNFYFSESFRTGRDLISSYWLHGTVSCLLMTKSGRFSLYQSRQRSKTLKKRQLGFIFLYMDFVFWKYCKDYYFGDRRAENSVKFIIIH